MPPLTDRVAFVTGAAGNLGTAVVGALLEAGANVAAAGHSEESLRRLEDEVRQAGLLGSLVTVTADVTAETQVASAMQQVLERWGRLDILVNVVGGFMNPTPVAELSLEEWHHQLALNLTSAFICCRAAVPLMVHGGGGRIVSIASKRAVEPKAGYAPYACAKAGVIALTQTLSEEVKAKGITVNAVLPSVIDTPANRDAMPKADPAKWVRPEQIADLIVYLCSAEAAAISGAAIPIYGQV